MTQTEACSALDLTKGTVSILVKKGMPLTSVDAANAWREQHAPPRKKAGQVEKSPVVEAAKTNATAKNKKPVEPIAIPQKPEAPPTPDPVVESRDSDPTWSVQMARRAEKAAWNKFDAAQRNRNTSPEEFRRLNATYNAARQNRMKAEQDYREWRRQEGITLFYSEAQDLIGKPHQLVAHMLQTGPRQLAGRLVNQPVKQIELALAEWCDNLSEAIRTKI